jgi:diguanylate cyclase (GGDEF)-like protein
MALPLRNLSSLQSVKLGVAIVIGGFVLVATYISVLISVRQEALQQVSRHNATWEAVQALTEFTRLEHRVAEFGLPASRTSKEEVGLRYEILLSRAKLLNEGDVQATIQQHPDLQKGLHRFEDALVTIEPAISNLEQPGAIDAVLNTLKPLESELAALASVAVNYGTQLVIQDQKELVRLHWLFSGLAATLIFCGVVLIAILYRHIQLLGRAHQKVHLLAHHDVLTGLGNRVQFRQELEQALADSEHLGHTAAVLYLDLDRFKYVNDSYGHQMGDALLKVVADRLRTCVREIDTITRLGGDEFAILQLRVSRPQECADLATRIIDVVGKPYNVDGQEIVIGTSIGIALIQEGNVAPDQLLKQADMALYRAKADGRATFRFFEPAMDAEVQARRALEADLRKALHNKEFELFYQQQVNILTNNVSGFEALLRWKHPERGTISPAEFIPVAEDIGLISEIGEWIIEQACLDAAAWPRGIKVAVNLSPMQFRNSNLVQSVKQALALSGLDPRRLELEITETVLLQDDEAILAMLHELRRSGVRIAMDDFGTGYSSLSYLRSFPFDKIKIDQSFVRELASRADCLMIVQFIANLGAGLGMPTVAEGVETEQQLLQVRAAGCTEAQGFYFGRPRPVNELVFSIYERPSFATA